MIIFFEGLSGAGKTTLIKNFSVETPNCRCIDEYTLPDTVNKFDTHGDKLVLDNDILKCKLALRYKTLNQYILVDRGPISTLVYGKLKSQYSTQDKQIFNSRSNWYINAIQTQELIIPDLYVFIDTPPEICYKRASDAGRVVDENFWYTDIHLARKTYLELFQEYIPAKKLIILNGSDSTQKQIINLKNILHDQPK